MARAIRSPAPRRCMETARTLAEMSRKGWKPKRTIMLAFWDGEEFGLIGSTEWMEKHADELNRKLAAYINSDSSGKGTLSAGGSHSLDDVMREALRDVNDPVSGKSLLDAVSGEDREDDCRTSPRSFICRRSVRVPTTRRSLQHLGIASLTLGFDNEAGEAASIIPRMTISTGTATSKIPTFAYERALSQLTATVTMRLADAPLLPFDFNRLARVGHNLSR